MPKLKAPSVKLFFALLLLISTAVRFLLSFYSKTAVTYNDELFYLELSQNIWLRGTLNVYAAPIRFTKLLYPLLLSPFYAVGDGLLRTRLISAFNTLLISSSLIPGYLLAKRVLKKDSHIMLALVVLALSPNLLFSLTFMAENLYYPLLLWAFWAAYRVLINTHFARRGVRGGDRKAPSVLGIILFLLYFTKETGAAFLAAVLIILLIKKDFKSFFLCLLGFGIPFLLVRFTLLRNMGYSYAGQVSLSNLQTASQLMYFFYATGIMLLFFLVSVLFFPVVLPFVQRKKLPSANRLLLYLSGIYVLLLAMGIAFGILVIDEFASIRPHIHLRYFLGAGYPFLLLFLSLREEEETASPNLSGGWKEFLRKPLVCLSGVFIACVLLFFFIPVRGSLVDYPLLHFADYLWPQSLKWVWLTKLALVAFVGLGLFLLRKKNRFFTFLVVLPLLVLELAGGAAFTSSARWEGKVRSPELAKEVTTLDEALDSLEGTVLVVTPYAHHPALKLLNTLSDNDYALAYSGDLRKNLMDHAEENLTALPMEALEIPVQFRRFSPAECYSLSSVDYILTVEDWDLIDPEQNEEITPEGVSSFRLYRAKDPSRLALLDPCPYTVGDKIFFHGSDLNYLNYGPKGFSSPESEFTWSADHEVSLSLHPDTHKALSATWSTKVTNGDQPYEIWANDTQVASGTISEPDTTVSFEITEDTWQDKGLLTLRFVFPDAKQPGNGDGRLLAVAFESITLK